MAKKKVTSSDVAKRAGVSQATVSMVLNKKYNVSFSKEVIQKVEAAAGELGYELPKRRTQRGERREKLLVVISPNLTNPYYVIDSECTGNYLYVQSGKMLSRTAQRNV